MEFEREILTGGAMGLGIIYILAQFGLRTIVTYKKWIDLSIFVFLLIIVFRVGSGYVTSITTWAGITVSLALLILRIFVKPYKPYTVRKFEEEIGKNLPNFLRKQAD